MWMRRDPSVILKQSKNKNPKRQNHKPKKRGTQRDYSDVALSVFSSVPFSAAPEKNLIFLYCLYLPLTKFFSWKFLLLLKIIVYTLPFPFSDKVRTPRSKRIKKNKAMHLYHVLYYYQREKRKEKRCWFL